MVGKDARENVSSLKDSVGRPKISIVDYAHRYAARTSYGQVSQLQRKRSIRRKFIEQSSGRRYQAWRHGRLGI